MDIEEATPDDSPASALGFTLEFDPRLLFDHAVDEAVREREWLRVFRHFDPKLRTHFGRFILDPFELDDLLAQVWRAALRKLGTLRSYRAAWSYLLRIGHNRLKDRWKNDARRRAMLDAYGVIALIEEDARYEAAVAGGDPLPSSWPLSPEEVVERVAVLSTEDRLLIELRHTRGLTHEEAATELGISAAAARKRYSRLLKQLRGNTS